MDYFHLEFLLRKAPYFIVILDVHGRVVFANDCFLNKTGWTLEEVVGVSWYTKFLTTESLWTMAQAYIKSANQGIDSAFIESELLAKSGEKLKVSMMNIYLREKDGQISNIANIGSEIVGCVSSIR
jgi:PAS domain S-box-containing protein